MKVLRLAVAMPLLVVAAACAGVSYVLSATALGLARVATRIRTQRQELPITAPRVEPRVLCQGTITRPEPPPRASRQHEPVCHVCARGQAQHLALEESGLVDHPFVRRATGTQWQTAGYLGRRALLGKARHDAS